MIDLSKIKAKELPKKTIKVNILGTVQEQEITVLTGENRIKSWSLDYTQNPEESTLKRVRICLTGGAGVPEKDAELLIHLDWDAAVEICGQVMEFTREFDDKISAEKSDAEKNLKAETETGIPG